MSLTTFFELSDAAATHEEHGREEQAAEVAYLAELSRQSLTKEELESVEGEQPAPSTVVHGSPGKLLADVEQTEIGWLWEKWIPLGRVTIFVGPSGGGKSTVASDLIARVTNGWPMPDGTEGYPGGAVVISLEEETSSETLPRLKRLGANITRIRDLSTVEVTSDGTNAPVESPFELPRDQRALEAAILAVKAPLVVIDPLMSVTHTSMARNQSVREFVGQLQRMARRLDVAILIVNHYTKQKKGSPIERMFGSAAIAHFPRTVIALSDDPADSTRKVLSLEKHSNSEGAQPLVFQWANGGRIEYIHGLTPSQAMIKQGEMESRNRAAILSLLQQNPGAWTPTDICQTLNIPGPNCRVTLMRLSNEGKIEKVYRGLYRFPTQTENVTNVTQNAAPASDVVAKVETIPVAEVVVPAVVIPTAA